MSSIVLEAGRRGVRVSNADKVLFPDDGITKADLAEHYLAVAPRMLPHLEGRPIAMERYPDGIGRHRIFQKDVPDHFPDWIARVRVKKEHGSLRQVLVDSAATLVYLADQACITPHAFLSTTEDLRLPDQLVFDLDPPGDDFALARRVALDLRGLLEDELGLPAFVKTTGGDGLHLLVPLDRSEDVDGVRAFARDVAAVLVARDPKRVTLEQRKDRRGRRLFLDVLRNGYAQTAVPPYAVRARPKAPVATPLAWDELDDSRLRPARFTIRTVRRRLDRGDPWRGLKRRRRSLSAARRRLARLRETDAA